MVSFFSNLVNDSHVNLGDGTAVGVSILALLQWIPHITAFLSLIWICLRLWVTIRDDFLKKEKNGNK